MTPSTTTASSGERERTLEAPKSAETGPQLYVRAGTRAGKGKQPAWLLAAVVVLAVVCAASLAVGARGLSLETVWQALTQFNPADGDHAVVHARIPRTILGLLAG